MKRVAVCMGIFALLFIFIGAVQSWVVSLSILNLCLISSMMALGVNIQWGYAGLFSVGTVGFAAIGGVAGVLVAQEPVTAAWQAGGAGLAWTFLIVVLTILHIWLLYRYMRPGRIRSVCVAVSALTGFFLAREFFIDATSLIEQVNPAETGYLGGAGLPIIFSWLIGGLFAAAIAWCIGKITLGLQSDYLAIATLGIGAIIVFVLKNEDWLARGVQNVTGLPRPVPYEIDLVQQSWFLSWAEFWSTDVTTAAAIFIKLCYAGLFIAVLALVMYFAECALRSPWGRMMRAIRDNPDAAEAMGKDVTGRRLQTFILGSAVIGIAGAMLTTLEGQFTPSSYHPLRFTFLVWVMVIVGGSGNNWGSIIGAFLIWFLWIESESAGLFLVDILTSPLDDNNVVRRHLLDNAAHMRMVVMGMVLLLVMRFHPKGLIPEKVVRRVRAS